MGRKNENDEWSIYFNENISLLLSNWFLIFNIFFKSTIFSGPPGFIFKNLLFVFETNKFIFE